MKVSEIQQGLANWLGNTENEFFWGGPTEIQIFI